MNPNYQDNLTNTSNPLARLISWRAAFAGLAVALLTFAGITALSLALGGIGLSDGTSGTAASIFTGAAFLFAVLVSTMAGSYYAVSVRGANAQTSKGAHAQGLLVGSLIILVVVVQAVSAVGMIGRAAGNTIGAAGAGVAAVAQNQVVQNVVEDSLGQLSLQSSPEVVLSGVTTRLMSGNEEGAKNYLARQAGISPTEADQRIAAARTNIDQALVQTREAAATTLKATGWTLFGVIVLGALASLLGSHLAFRALNASPAPVRSSDKTVLKKSYQT